MTLHLTQKDLQDGNLPRTTCLKCKTLVRQQSVYYDRGSEQYIILVLCHGEWDRKAVRWDEFETGFVYEGTAFKEDSPVTVPDPVVGYIDAEFTEVTEEMKPGFIKDEKQLNLPVVWYPSKDLACCPAHENDSTESRKNLNTPSTERVSVAEWAPLMREAL